MIKQRVIDLALETIQMRVPLSPKEVQVIIYNLGLVYAAGYDKAAERATTYPRRVEQWQDGILLRDWDNAHDAARALELCEININKAAAGYYSRRPGRGHSYGGSEWRHF